MVQKTSHRGVHSGNTLRAFNSRYSRRYHNQACIVSRVRPELLEKLENGEAAKTADDNNTPKQHNFSVDVALSLNKQARWLLPSALIRQIETDNIADSDLTVSVLERHKLKRPANCVSFHANKGQVKRIQTRNGRYVGFNFPRADGKSRRALRRERRTELQAELKKTKVDGKLKGNTVEVFTEQGKALRDTEIGETEVRYEVFYPCPPNSSISHNPKYIKHNVDVAFEDEDEHVQHGKPKKQHRGKRRKRMTLKDIEDWELSAIDSQYCQTFSYLANSAVQDESASFDDISAERNTTECLLSSLIEKAQQLQKFKGKPRRKRNKASVDQDDKSHVVYLEEFQNAAKEQNSDEEVPGSTEPSPPSPAMQSVSPIPSESTRVLLPKEDVTMASLNDCFGQCYFEAGCQPRKFVLDVTSNVRELLKKQGIQAKVAENTEEALSYLICAHDGIYDDQYDVYRVLLNSKLHDGLLAVEINRGEENDLFRGTVMSLISQTMDFMQGLVTILKDKKYFPLFFEDKMEKVAQRHLNNHIASSDIYVPSVKRLFQMGSNVSTVTMPTLSEMFQPEPVFCDVCYDDISPLTHDSTPSTSLLTCNHHVCDSCWSQHIHVRLHEGFVRLTCPGYDCQEEVKVGVLLSVAPLNTVDKLLQRQEEVRIGASETEKWCPNESCGRVISLQPSTATGELHLQQDVVCVCGTHVCFQCLTPAHWPASCKQAEDYRANLATAVFPDRLAEVHDDYEAEEVARQVREQEKKSTMLVEGKHCPRCKSFVFKNGGCPQMTCRCGQLFCWFCAKPGYSHPDRRGCVDAEQEKLLTTTIIVRHVENSKLPEDTKKPQSSPGNRRQRMSLMERAVEHRQQEHKVNNNHAITTLAKAVATAAGKNRLLIQHITKACCAAFPSSMADSKQGSSADVSGSHINSPSTVLGMVTTFLKNAAHSRKELLEVVEYSLVLLKDLPDSLLRRRALRVSEDLGAFCSFSQSIFDVWGKGESSPAALQEAVKAVMRLAEIQGWIQGALNTHVLTVRKLRNRTFRQQ